MKVLVIEDDPDTIYLVSVCLTLRWPNVEVLEALTGREGLDQAEREAPDLIILDLGLPDIDGRVVLERVRQSSDVPVIILSGRDRDLDIAAHLEGGADDYVTKPFSSVELLARVQAVTRRSMGRVQAGAPALTAGDLLLDFAAAEVYKDGEAVQLTLTELRILEQMAHNARRVVTYDQLAGRALNIDNPGPDDTRLIRVHVQHLRSKLGDSADHPTYISNVRGVGYKFMPSVSPMLGAGDKGGQ